jgi:GMP synthase (glutamine-hydrolysing)
MFESRSFVDECSPDASNGTEPLRRAMERAERQILFILHGEESCPGRVGQCLRRKGYTIEQRKPRFGSPLPTSLDGYAGVVVFGGPMSCNDPEPWIKAEIDLAGQAVAAAKPFFGICLGAQMLAKALGATVAPHPERRVEIGYYPVEPTPLGQSLGPWPDQVYHWHNEGFELPSGAQLLAQGQTFPNQAYAFGSAVGVQFHPEITYALVNRWTTEASFMLSDFGARPASEHRIGHLHHAVRVTDWLDPFLDRWLDGSLASALTKAGQKLPLAG